MEKPCSFGADRNSLCHGHNTADYSRPPVDRSTPDLAVQQRLGILSKRWVRLDSINRANPRVDGANLDDNRLVNKRWKFLDWSQAVEVH
jgi:hypothetical protein